MRKNICVLLATVLSFSIAFSNTKVNASTITNSTVTDILSISAGNGDTEVGYTPSMPEVERMYPQSFDVTNDGKRIYILDNVKNRILVYDSNKLSKIIPLSFITEAKDIAVVEDSIYVLSANEDQSIFQVDLDGKLLNVNKKVNIPNLKQIDAITNDSSNSLKLISQNKEYDLNSKTESKIPTAMKTSNKMGNIKSDNANIQVNFNEIYGSINIQKITNNGDLFVSIEDVADCSKVIVENTVREYDKKGNIVGIGEIPMERYVSFPNKFMKVTDDGKVYIMILEKDKLTISNLTLGNTFNSKLKEKKAQYENQESTLSTSQPKVLSASVVPNGVIDGWTRSTANSRANDMINDWWTYWSSNGRSVTGVTKPDYLVNYSYGSQCMGIPYCWGGFDGIDTTSTSSWSNFNDAMSKGNIAGNVYCSGTYKSGTAGVDCSGFISSAIQSSTKLGTYGLYDLSSDVSTGSMKSMDIFINVIDHVLFYSSSDSTTVYSKEATTSGDDKAKNYSRTWSWLSANNYKARAFAFTS